MAYSVVIAEDFRMIREIFENAVRQSDCYTAAASFPTAVQAVDWLRDQSADLVLMDVLFPGSMNGLDAAREIKRMRPKTKIIFVTSMPEVSYTEQARQIGIESFWHKEVQELPILEVMDRTMAGESIYPGIRLKVSFGNTTSADLTERETAVLRELVGGSSNKQIAETLGVSEETVKTHLSNLLQKTGYSSRLELALKARHLGIAIKD